MHFTNFYLHVLTTKDYAQNTETRTYIIKIKFPHVGDYVSYKPDTPSAGYNLKSVQSGYNTDQVIDTSYDPTEWRVMEVDENRRITKLFGVPNNNQKSISFGGARGYNNVIFLLNDICAYRYKNSSLNATARSLNLSNLESQMNSNGIAKKTKYVNPYGSIYGTTFKMIKYKKYPILYAKEQYSGIDVSNVTNGTQIINGSINTSALNQMNPNGKKQNDAIYASATTVDTYKESSNSLTCTQTFYGGIGVEDYENSKFFETVLGNNISFFIASRSIDINCLDLFSTFGIYFAYEDGNLGAYALFQSSGYSPSIANHIAPVVSFGDIIIIKNGDGTINNPYTIGK